VKNRKDPIVQPQKKPTENKTQSRVASKSPVKTRPTTQAHAKNPVVQVPKSTTNTKISTTVTAKVSVQRDTQTSPSMVQNKSKGLQESVNVSTHSIQVGTTPSPKRKRLQDISNDITPQNNQTRSPAKTRTRSPSKKLAESAKKDLNSSAKINGDLERNESSQLNQTDVGTGPLENLEKPKAKENEKEQIKD